MTALRGDVGEYESYGARSGETSHQAKGAQGRRTKTHNWPGQKFSAGRSEAAAGGSKNFLRDRSEQLGDFLRSRILAGELSNPLPPTRLWCRQLGVGRPNLLRALAVLKDEGLVSVSRQGATILPNSNGSKTGAASRAKTLRILYPAGTVLSDDLHLVEFSAQLQQHGIQLAIECCSLTRLKAIAAQPHNSRELLVLLSIPSDYHKYFEEAKKPAIVVGFTGAEASLPNLTPDLNGSTRHAALSLLRRGFKRLVMINVATKMAGVEQSVLTFQNTCREWRHQPVRGEVHLIWNDWTSVRTSIARIVSSLHEPCGFVIFSPISVGILVTSLLRRGISIPEQAAIMAIEHRTDEVQYCVPTTLYSAPASRYVRELLHAAVHFFQNGKVPKVHKVLTMNVTHHG